MSVLLGKNMKTKDKGRIKSLKFYLAVISVIFLALALYNVISSVNTLERGDNYYHILGAKGAIKYNLMPFGDYDIFQHKSDALLGHPPLYNYIFALILWIFKVPFSLNFLNIIMTLATGFLLIKTLRIIFKEISDSTLLIIFALFLFTPLIVQASYLVDLDGILMFFMLLFTYFYLKNPNRIILNSLLLLIVCFTKLQGVPILVLSLILYLVLTKKSKKEWISLISVFLISSALFLILIFAYASLLHVNAGRMFVHSSIIDILIKQIKTPARTFLTSFWAAKQLVIWVLPTSIFLYSIGVIGYFKNNFRKNEKLLLPVLISLITLLELIPIGTYGWNFPRYYPEFVPFMCIALAGLIKGIRIERRDLYKIFFLIIVSSAYFLIIPDPFIPEVSEAFTQKDYASLSAKVLFNFDLIILPVLLVLVFFWRGINKEKILKIIVISSIVLSLSIGIMQLTKPYSTNNLYGDSHKNLQETISYLKDNMNSTDKALLFDHVGYYFGNSDNTNWYNSMLCYNSETCMQNITDNGDVKFMQFYPKDLERINGKLKIIINQSFELDKNFGDYIIYRRIE